MQAGIDAAQDNNRGFAVALMSAIVLSFTGIFIKIISEDYQLPALILAFWRDSLTVVCALPFLIIFKPGLLRIKKTDLKFLLAFGILLSLFNILWTLSVILTGASIATVLVYSSAGFTAILGYFLLSESLGWVKLSAVGLSLVGCLLVSGAVNPQAWLTNPLGIITGLFSGLLYAAYSLMGRQATMRSLNPWTTLFYTFLIAAFILLTLNILPFDFIPATAVHAKDVLMFGLPWRGWLLLLALAAGPTLIGFGLYNVSLSLLPSSTANLILTFEPIVTVITAYFILGERLTILELAGSGLILFALILLRIIKSG